MIKEIEYKLQGDGKDSWHVTIWDSNTIGQGDMVSREIVWDDPATYKEINLIDILSNATSEEIDYLKQALGIEVATRSVMRLAPTPKKEIKVVYTNGKVIKTPWYKKAIIYIKNVFKNKTK